jgi:fermentation-respiration switch protein FrsA (DUF1100 family)
VNPARPRRLAALVLPVLLAATAGLIGSPATAAPAPGTVLTATTATLPPELAPLATGKRIQYLTTDLKGNSIPATGLVLTPTKNKTNRTVVWSHGSTGLADRCAPSANQAVFWPEARAAIAKLLQKGWSVTAPDYPGLGTALPHPYLVGASEGRSIIDSVKAARNLDSALTTQYAVDGHSQGGQGALFAGQLAPSYDGPLVLKGVAAIAPASNLHLIAEEIPGDPGQGYLVMAMYGIQAVEPSFVPSLYLATPARARVAVISTGCLYEILNSYASLTPEQLVPNGVVPQVVKTKLEQYGDPGNAPSSAPILIVQGTADEAVPYEITRDVLVPKLEEYDPPVEFIVLQGRTHDGAVFDSTETVANWIAARFR